MAIFHEIPYISAVLRYYAFEVEMTELLKVLKFIFKRERKRALKALYRAKRYKGLYAFLGGVMVFSFCFAGRGGSVISYNGAYAALLLPAAENALIDTEQSAPLADSGALLSIAKNSAVKAQRVPYIVFPDSTGVSRDSKASADLNNTSRSGGENEENDVSLLSISPEKTSVSLGTTEEPAADNVGADEIESGSENVSEDDSDNGTEDEEKNQEGHADEEENTENSLKWSETEASGTKYVNTDLIYSRKEAVEGSEKINRYRINDAVEVEALTDTHYYKLKSGEFIHEDYLSDKESAKWTESPAEGIMYIKNGGIYSREEALEGSAKVNRYNLNDTVTVTAITNTDYYKIAEGEFIHSDFLSPTEVVDYPLSTQYGQRAQTAWEQDLSQQVFDVVNSVRAEYGLKPFKQLDSLNAAAAERAWETTVYNSHTRPDGSRCFTVLDEYGLKNPSTKAENIAKWYSSAQSVVNAWMSDYAHRSAILGEHEYMGVGCYYVAGDYYGYYWTQVFYTP